MLESMKRLIEVSLGCGAVIALVLVLTPVLSKRFSPDFRRWVWLALAIRLLTFGIELPVPMPKAPIQMEVPQAVTEGTYNSWNDAVQDRLAKGGSGGGTVRGDGYYYRHYLSYQNESGEMVTIRDGEWVRTVTIGDTTTRTVHWTAVAGAAYFSVGVLIFAISLLRYRRFRKKALRWSMPAGETDQNVLAEWQERLDCTAQVALYRCSLVRSPLLMGYRAPVILLPEDLPDSALETSLAHELTHLKRKDTGYKLYILAACCIHWCNPMVWLMLRQADRDVELCCDYDLLRRRDESARRAYGQAILDQMTAGAALSSRLTTGFSGDKKEVFARFRAIMDTSVKKKGRAALALTLAAVLLAGGLVACQTKHTEADGKILAWVSKMDKENGVTYYPLDWIAESDFETETAWWEALRESGCEGLGKAQTAPFADEHPIVWRMGVEYGMGHQVILSDLAAGEDTKTLYIPDNSQPEQDTPLGDLCELSFDEDGAVVKVMIRNEKRLHQKNPTLALGTVDQEMTTVHYQPIAWIGWNDPGREAAFWNSLEKTDLGETKIAELAGGAEVLYQPERGGAYPLNPATIEYSIHQTTEGARLLELTFNDEGQVIRLVMRGDVSLDLNAANLDFTGYTGRVYAVGAGGISHASDTAFLNLDPCDLIGEDHDHTRYNLPLAEGTEIPDELKPFLSGLSSGRYPEFYELELVSGEVVRLTGIWDEESATISLGYAVLLDHYTGILGIQNREELSSYQPGDDFLMKGDTKLPLAENADIPDEVLPFLSGQSQDPDLLQYALVMEDGVVTAVLGIWKDSTSKGDLPDYTGTLYGAEMRGPIEVNGKDYLVLDGYRIPLEEACSTELKEQLSSLSDTGTPGLYEVTVEDGEVTTIRAF